MNLWSIPQLARDANRAGEIVAVLGKYGLADWLGRLDWKLPRRLVPGKSVRSLAELTTETRIRLVLIELGTTFVKLGQILSTRADLVGPSLARELSSLQTDTPADPPDRVRATVEAELGKPLEELFAAFDLKPIASASIGQVHRARLRDGAEVVVKVQHPDIERRIRTDLEILVGLAELAEQHLPDLRPYQPRATAVEAQRILLRELDFSRERRHLEQFALHFRDDPTVHFPAPHPELCTGRVLTMEYLDGTKLSDAEKLLEQGIDHEAIACKGAAVFLEMIFRDGFYHADPHPGNILILRDGAIGLLDCGMVGRIDAQMQEDIEEMLVAVGHLDAATLTRIAVRVGSIPPDLDRAALAADLTDFLSYYSSQPLDKFQLGAALTEAVEIIRRYHILLPASLSLLIKMLVMLEGTSRLLNPRFHLSELVQPYYKKLVWRRLSPTRQLRRTYRTLREWQHLAEVLPGGLAQLVQRVQRGEVDVHVEHKHLDSSVNRLAFGLLTSSLFLGSALMLSMGVAAIGGVSVPGTLGCIFSMGLALRLIRAIQKSGHLDA
jgi:ubiquinone biosynthesis protein